MPVDVGIRLAAFSEGPPARLTFDNVFLTTGNTLVLVLMAHGAYSNVDPGPVADQYTGTYPFVAVVAADVSTTDTRIFVGGRLSEWPVPSPPYTVLLEPGGPPYEEEVTVTNIDLDLFAIDVIRGTIPVSHPAGVTLQGERDIIDTGYTPPLLYASGDPTQAPAKTGSWYAQVKGATVDPSMAAWQSRYWQSAPTAPVGHPLWATLCMLARRIDGTETASGLVDALNNVTVEIQGSVPNQFLFNFQGALLQMSPTPEILPLPETPNPTLGNGGDLLLQPTSPTTPDPAAPPFSFVYPPSAWTQWISSTPMNDEDLFLTVLLSQLRLPPGEVPSPIPTIKGFTDATGTTEDNPVPMLLDNNFPVANSYVVQEQIGASVFRHTHDPNPIVDELSQIGIVVGGAGVSPAGFNTARMPVVGQDPWWELQDVKIGALETGFDSVMAPAPATFTDDIMLLVAQSNGETAPADPADWTLIPSLSGPNVYSGEPVTIHTNLSGDALAGATTMRINVYDADSLPLAPLTVVCEGETLTATSVNTSVYGDLALTLSSAVGADHLSPAAVDLTPVTPLEGIKQYVAVWWRVAEGPPPSLLGVPAPATTTPPLVTFPDASRCGARCYAVTADLTNPLSQLSLGGDACSRLDVPAPAAMFTVTDVLPADGITQRLAIGLAIGGRGVGIADELAQDITQQTVFMQVPGPSPEPPTFSWLRVEPDGIGCALYLAFRGKRERPPYELVDGHFGPTYQNRGALPPCAGGGLFLSTDYRAGPGLSFRSGTIGGTGAVVVQQEGQIGSTAYLHAWVWAEAGMPNVIGYIYQRSAVGAIINDTVWFEVTPSAFDTYIDPPASPQFFTRDNPYCYRLVIQPGTLDDGYAGINAWSEEECQAAPAASFGLAAGFRYGSVETAQASSQQASIVG